MQKTKTFKLISSKIWLIAVVFIFNILISSAAICADDVTLNIQPEVGSKAQPAFVKEPLPELKIDANCNDLYKNIRACTEYRCQTPKPDGSGQIVMHYVQGKNEKGDCTHQQSWGQGNDILTCNYSEEGRKFVATTLEKQSQGYKSSDDEMQLMGQIFDEECSVNEFDFGQEGRVLN